MIIGARTKRRREKSITAMSAMPSTMQAVQSVESAAQLSRDELRPLRCIGIGVPWLSRAAPPPRAETRGRQRDGLTRPSPRTGRLCRVILVFSSGPGARTASTVPGVLFHAYSEPNT